MKEDRIARRRVYWKLLALITLSVGALVIRQPREVAAFDFNCDGNYNNCINSCYVDAEWANYINYILPSDPTPKQIYGCAKTCNTNNSSCLSEDGWQQACDNIFGQCGTLDGSDVGDCYQSYADCEFGHMQKHFSMLQCVVQDTSPCREQAWSDFWACRSNPADFGCPEGMGDCCLGLERAELANCNCD